jgi:hypothetical protein
MLRFELVHPPVNVQMIKVDPEKPNPKLGVGILEFNCTGSMLLTRNGILKDEDR